MSASYSYFCASVHFLNIFLFLQIPFLPHIPSLCVKSILKYVFTTTIFNEACLQSLKTHTTWASLVSQMVRNLPAMKEIWVWSLDWEDTLEKGMAAHSSILAWRIPWTEEPGEPKPMGSQRVGQNQATNTDQ